VDVEPRPQANKTRKGRVIAVVGPLREIIDRRLSERRLDSPLIFHRTSKGRLGQPIRDLPATVASRAQGRGIRAWSAPLRPTAFRAPQHDPRRTDYTVAMKISGHRTHSTFDRYNITSAEDIHAAISRTAAYVATLSTERNVAAIEDSQKTPIRTSGRKAR
jgi:integrase